MKPQPLTHIGEASTWAKLSRAGQKTKETNKHKQLTLFPTNLQRKAWSAIDIFMILFGSPSEKFGPWIVYSSLEYILFVNQHHACSGHYSGQSINTIRLLAALYLTDDLGEQDHDAQR